MNPLSPIEPRVIASRRDGSDARDATLIHWRERDRYLDLQNPDWGQSLATLEWEEAKLPSRHFCRNLSVDLGLGESGPDGEGRRRDDAARVNLREHMVRFPSAPIYGINRKDDYSLTLPERPSLHTIRILLEDKADAGMADRVFVLHNGLNETSNLSFYYQLIAWILREGESQGYRPAFLIVPFPGHLMHAPFAGPFAQTPLSRYLADAGDLFRQFLRYMIEMRWLLSLLVKKPVPEWQIGSPLLDRDGLGTTLHREWLAQRACSKAVWEDRHGKALEKDAETATLGPKLKAKTIADVLDVPHRILRLDASASPDRMPIHVVGYSLGGFLAQSVFFSWPNLVASCATICSGGAIRALSPTAFAHSEEWQAVMHALRPELEESMLARRVSREKGRVSGLAEDQFRYYQRIFDQVFLQEDKGSYKARLSEYGTRMLFVSGGEDPIVRTREVLDASPAEGITMLSIASLTHFLSEPARNVRENSQREFWLPTAGGLIGRAAARAEILRESEEKDAAGHHAEALAGSGPEEDGPPKRPSRRDLASPKFEEALDWLIEGVTSTSLPDKKGRGWLFICRAGIPAAFLSDDMRRASAAGLHHHDVSVQQYAAGLARRAAAVPVARTTLVLPAGLKSDFVESDYAFVDPHSDAPGYMTTRAQRSKAWSKFRGDWGEQSRWLKAGPVSESLLNIGPDSQRLAERLSRWQDMPADRLFVTHLPDVWICVDGKNVQVDDGDHRGAAAAFVDWVCRILEEEPPVREAKRPIRAAGEYGRALQRDLDSGAVRIVGVSGAELNPRYRGRYEQSFWPSILLLAHCAAALVRSKDRPDRPATIA